MHAPATTQELSEEARLGDLSVTLRSIESLNNSLNDPMSLSGFQLSADLTESGAIEARFTHTDLEPSGTAPTETIEQELFDPQDPELFEKYYAWVDDILCWELHPAINSNETNTNFLRAYEYFPRYARQILENMSDRLTGTFAGPAEAYDALEPILTDPRLRRQLPGLEEACSEIAQTYTPATVMLELFSDLDLEDEPAWIRKVYKQAEATLDDDFFETPLYEVEPTPDAEKYSLWHSYNVATGDIEVVTSTTYPPHPLQIPYESVTFEPDLYYCDEDTRFASCGFVAIKHPSIDEAAESEPPSYQVHFIPNHSETFLGINSFEAIRMGAIGARNFLIFAENEGLSDDTRLVGYTNSVMAAAALKLGFHPVNTGKASILQHKKISLAQGANADFQYKVKIASTIGDLKKAMSRPTMQRLIKRAIKQSVEKSVDKEPGKE